MTTSLDHGRFWRDLAGVRPKVIADLRERVLPLFRSAWDTVLARHEVGVPPWASARRRARAVDRTLIVAERELPECAALLAELTAWTRRWGLPEWTESFALETLEQWALFGADAPPVVFFQGVKSKRPGASLGEVHTRDDIPHVVFFQGGELYAQGEQLAAEISPSVEEAVKDQLLAEKYRRDQRAHKAKIAAAEKATHERHVQAGEARAAERWADRPAMWASWQKSAAKLWRHDATLSTYKVAHLIADATGHPWRTIEKHINKPV